MFTVTLQSIYNLTPENSWFIVAPIAFTFNNVYYLELDIIPPLSDKRKQIEGRFKIMYIYGGRKTLTDERFLNSIKKRIVKKEEPGKPLDKDYKVCLLGLEIRDPLDTQYFIRAKMSVINKDLIDSLLTTNVKKKDLIDLTERFLKQDYKSAIKEAGIFGEYIAKQFLNKLKKNFTSFNSAVNHLSHLDKTSRMKINYKLIGNYLHPIYFLRNEAMHPNPEIPMGETAASLVLTNLSGLVKYLSANL